MFYNEFFLSSLFFRCLISELVERSSTKIGHMLGSDCDLKTHVQNLGYSLALQIGGPKPPFAGQLRNLTVNLTAYIIGMKHDIDNRSSAFATTRISYIIPKCHELWSTNGFKLDRHFITLCKFCFLRHRQPSQTDISK